MVGEHDDRGGRRLGPDPPRGLQPLVALGRRHPHIGDHQLGTLRQRLAHERGAVAGRADHVMPRIEQDALERVPQDRLVFADDDAHARRATLLPEGVPRNGAVWPVRGHPGTPATGSTVIDPPLGVA
jgi:hypothetical protein